MSIVLSVLFAAALAAQPDNAPPPKAIAPKAHNKKAEQKPAPDPDLLGFLGDYEDAADGLDPIGLSEQINDDTNAAANEKKKDGKQP